MIKNLVSLLVASTFLVSCATPKVVEKRKINDENLTCKELIQEIKEAEEFKEKALREKGFTGTNATAAVFFWPAILATYGNVNDAVNAADARKDHLESIYKDKKCFKAKR